MYVARRRTCCPLGWSRPEQPRNGCWVIFSGRINGNFCSNLPRNAVPNYHYKPSQSQSRDVLGSSRITYVHGTERDRDGPLPRVWLARNRGAVPSIGVGARSCCISSFGCSSNKNNSRNNRNNSNFIEDSSDKDSSCRVYWERKPSCHVGRSARRAAHQRPPWRWTERVQLESARSGSAAGTPTDDVGAASISPAGTSFTGD